MKTVDVLKLAKELIAKGWCQYYAAIGAGGRPVFPGSSYACKWCLTGSLVGAISMKKGLASYTELLRTSSFAMREALGTDALMAWNDAPDRTQEDVLAAFDKGIAIAEAVTVEPARKPSPQTTRRTNRRRG